MNASQRRIIRRAVLTALPLQSTVITPTGSEGKIVGVTNSGRGIAVKLKNHSVKTYPKGQLQRAL